MKQLGGYQLLRELPRGRAGRRYVASNPRPVDPDEEIVAVTQLDDERLNDAAYMAILTAECGSAISFRNTTAARVLEVNRIDNAVAIVVELIDGQPLHEVLARTRERATRLSWEFFVWLGVQVARVLQVAHATPWAEGEVKGMFHGQLCPLDVYVTYGGYVKVNGIGLGRSRARLPYTDARLPYRAPELFDRHKADHLTDIYGLGLLLHDSISGRTTFKRDTQMAMRRAVVEGEVPPLHLDAPTIPPELATLLGSMLAKLPTERPSSLFEIEKRLREHLPHPDEYYASGLAEQMKILFKTSASASPLPPVIMPEPKPLVVVDTPWGAESGQRTQTDDGLIDELGIDELVHLIAQRRHSEDTPGFGSSRARAVGAHPMTPPPVMPPDRGFDDSRSPFFAAIREEQERTRNAQLRAGEGTPFLEPPEPGQHHRWDPPPPSRPPPLVAPYISNPPKTPPKARSTSSSPRSEDPRVSESPRPSPLSALDSGSSSDLDDLVDAIVASGSQPDEEPKWHNAPSKSDADSGFEIERNETPFPVYRTETPLGPVSDDVLIEAPEEMARPSSSPYETPMPPGSSDEIEGPLFSPGDMVTERYRVIGLLGEGGVSVVYRAEHQLLMKQVAIKVMRPELSAMPTAKERFQREARSVCQLDHPNIARVTDFGYAHDGRMFLVMELVEGESLAQVVERIHIMDPSMALSLAVQLLRGLRHAHERGVVHRDLKPDNIVVAVREGESVPKILDFGIAKLTDQQQGASSITQAGTVFGTPRYMSPEQAAGESIDERTDLYTIGVILYQLMTGRMPFDGESTVQILSRVLTQPPPPMMITTPTRDAGKAIERLVLKAMEKERRDRFASATDFLMSIESVAREHSLFG